MTNRADEIERAATELIDAQDAVYVTRWDQSR